MSKNPTGFVVAALVAVLLLGGTGRSAETVAQASCTYRLGGALPDPKCTPGTLNHAVTQATIRTTICKSGWASSVRPPFAVTEPQKFKSMRAYGLPRGTSARGYEFDHLVPIELGGAVDDVRNLFPEPHHVAIGGSDLGSYTKDKVENKLRARVCSGAMKLRAARRIFQADWTKGIGL